MGLRLEAPQGTRWTSRTEMCPSFMSCMPTRWTGQTDIWSRKQHDLQERLWMADLTVSSIGLLVSYSHCDKMLVQPSSTSSASQGSPSIAKAMFAIPCLPFTHARSAQGNGADSTPQAQQGVCHGW